MNKPGWAPVKLPQTGNIVQTERQYTVAQGMDLYSEEDMTFAFTTTLRPIAILTATLALLTAHRAGTATAAPSPGHSWQELITSHQTK